MYDTSFDNVRSDVPRSYRGALWSLRIAALVATIVAASAEAQMPGAPVLQNAWATPGLVAAIDVAGGTGGALYAGALSWTPNAGRFQLIGGGGFETAKGSGSSSRGVYGVRAAVPFGGASSTFGFAGFAGIGGGAARKVQTIVNPFNGSTVDSSVNTTEIPVGVGIGWRRPIRGSQGLSIYATPSYVFVTGSGKTSGLLRTSIGADFGMTSALGATVGIEFGGARPSNLGGPRGTLFGLGASYALGRR